MTELCAGLPEGSSDGCEVHVTAPQSQAVCPTNRQIGKRVDLLTLKAMLAIPLTHLPAAEYFFCRAVDCPTVYYSQDGAHLFNEADLREGVYQKHPQDETSLVCYCFRHSVGSIRQALAQTGANTVMATITAGLQAGQCACDIRNPQDTCCLGNVRTLVQRLETERPTRSDHDGGAGVLPSECETQN